ncbi:MAG: hypothetical protein JHC98_05215 [Thermoleophilaceae bacterium]|nr:hypothetical protein [Thermoleophilaceae bacterium]
MRFISKRKLRSALLSVAAIAALASIGAGNASAAATLNVTADKNGAGDETTLTLNTAVSGWFNANKQYGANIQLPSAIGIQYPAYGSAAQRCPVSNISTVNGTYGAYRAFVNTNCPDTAKVGTATLGSASGTIYFVDSSPTPHFGVWFDQGVSTPYGRVLNLNWNGSAPLLTIRGLPNTATSGLTLSFNNASRPTLPGKIWQWVEGGASECVNNPNFTGSVLTYPLIGTTPTTTTMTPKSLTLRGCKMSYSLTTDSADADAYTALTLKSILGSGGAANDTRQYGVSFHTPTNVAMSFPGYGNQNQDCNASALNNGTIGTLNRKSRRFIPDGNCPPEAEVGTATLGSISGKIYIVGISPLPVFAVYFDEGTSTPFGMEIARSWADDGAETMSLYGLPDVASNGLELSFNNPSRPSGLPTKVWVNQELYLCLKGDTTADIYTYPTSGTTVDVVSGVRGPFHHINGCSS